MGYAEQNSVEKGLRFKTRSGLVVQTTGSTTHIASTNVYVHEVEILQGPGGGSKFLHNLDYAEPDSPPDSPMEGLFLSETSDS